MAHLCPVADLLLADGERQVTQDAVSRVCCVSQLPLYRARLPTDIRLWGLHVGHHGVRSSKPGRSTLKVLKYKYKYFPPQKYLSTSTFNLGEMYLSTF